MLFRVLTQVSVMQINLVTSLSLPPFKKVRFCCNIMASYSVMILIKIFTIGTYLRDIAS